MSGGDRYVAAKASNAAAASKGSDVAGERQESGAPHAVVWTDGKSPLAKASGISRLDEAEAVLWGLAHTKRLTGKAVRRAVRRYFGGHVPKVVSVMEHKNAELRARLDAVRPVVGMVIEWADSDASTSRVLSHLVPADIRAWARERS